MVSTRQITQTCYPLLVSRGKARFQDMCHALHTRCHCCNSATSSGPSKDAAFGRGIAAPGIVGKSPGISEACFLPSMLMPGPTKCSGSHARSTIRWFEYASLTAHSHCLTMSLAACQAAEPILAVNTRPEPISYSSPSC